MELDAEYTNFFEHTPFPSNYSNTVAKVKCFIDRHSEDKRKIVLVTVRLIALIFICICMLMDRGRMCMP
jgi:hypothetical protein